MNYDNDNERIDNLRGRIHQGAIFATDPTTYQNLRINCLRMLQKDVEELLAWENAPPRKELEKQSIH